MASAKKKVSKLKKKMNKVMGEFGKGELHSGSKKGPKVTSPKQAVAIAYSEGRKEEGKEIKKSIKKHKKEAPKSKPKMKLKKKK